MNEKFFLLPEEKQQAILNAGYRVFSQNSYKKSPMHEIADAAGISKGLLFYYFHNKKELYLFLWETCAQLTIRELTQSGCYQRQELFDAMYLGMQVKIRLMRQYPDLGAFVVSAFYETDPEVCGDIQKSIEKYAAFRENVKLLNFNAEQFVPGIDPKMMYEDMYRSSVGYLWTRFQQGRLDVDEMAGDFMRMLAFWKEIYQKKGK